MGAAVRPDRPARVRPRPAAARHWRRDVITSYSIHYTKLYEILEAAQGLTDLPPRGQQVGHLVGFDAVTFRRSEGLDHPVNPADGIVDDIESDAHAAESRGNGQVGIGRGQIAGRMVVNDHVAGATVLEDGRNCLAVTAGQHIESIDPALIVKVAEAEVV